MFVTIFIILLCKHKDNQTNTTMSDTDHKRKEKVPMTEFCKRRKMFVDMKAAIAAAGQKQDEHYKLEAQITALQY